MELDQLEESPEPVLVKEERWSVAASFIVAIVALWPLAYPIIFVSFLIVSVILYPILNWILQVKRPQNELIFVSGAAVSVFLAYLVGKRIYLACRWKTVEYDGSYCIRCQYDLTGNESGICPECGTSIPAVSA
ncbi:MAG: hypothetical protein DHS20C16_05340 [Phycisphaerae bacterium]|nr:MAG: hypothetical protein DHS20C16_05340 [Phycisphaerae bacterium]